MINYVTQCNRVEWRLACEQPSRQDQWTPMVLVKLFKSLKFMVHCLFASKSNGYVRENGGCIIKLWTTMSGKTHIVEGHWESKGGHCDLTHGNDLDTIELMYKAIRACR